MAGEIVARLGFRVGPHHIRLGIYGNSNLFINKWSIFMKMHSVEETISMLTHFLLELRQRS